RVSAKLRAVMLCYALARSLPVACIVGRGRRRRKQRAIMRKPDLLTSLTIAVAVAFAASVFVPYL
ncbi:hypothetical protein, partial [Arhodomonas sp. KWT]|uniref:hypothetical protein n=1 Tax=Arhodomonas sp. KWT TaxID=2679915 RepID=UPI00196A0809